MTELLHITSHDQWQDAQAMGEYRPPTLIEEGFIHCSRPEQLIAVANDRFAGQAGLLLLQIDSAQVSAEIRYEDCYETGQEFPHIYGPLPLSAVTQVIDFRPGPDGFFTLPDGFDTIRNTPLITTRHPPAGHRDPLMKKAKTILKWSFIIVLILLVVSTLGIVVYTQIATAKPEAAANQALLSTDEVLVENDEWLVFRPAGSAPTTGLIFYPGALVDPRAYAPYAQDIAAAGYLVVIPPMPLNLAILNANEAEKIMETFPEIDHWALGGHSLGGVMATQFIKDYPWAAEGLALWGAYPAGGSDVSCRVLDAVSIYGTLDGLSTPEEILASQELLPPDTIYVPIQGGNHAQFGWYGIQKGDLTAEINHQEQQAQTVTATVQMLERIEARKSEEQLDQG